jgi:hypothetical protein
MGPPDPKRPLAVTRYSAPTPPIRQLQADAGLIAQDV